MEKRILFGNNISNVGKVLSKDFAYYNFNVSYCGNTHENILKNLENTAYDGLFFFVNKNSAKLHSFVRHVRKSFPDLKIYPLIALNSDVMRAELIKDGATDSFLLPEMSSSLCFEVIYDFFEADEIIVSIEIAKFLIDLGFPNHTKGFYFLCLCIEKIIDEPEMFNNFSKLLYPFIREKTNSSEAWIERSIRNLSKIIFKKGITFDNYPDEKNLSNKTLVKLLADLYCKANKIKRRKID
ncbi:MAG: sporulation initiation factor Spo0A C-terminal domain-containing protein [Ruminococcus flavefaciens]|nr:sporulation initiation factor Spo0A C-terminal domain-containing protein [Ruminococcus flavefaciens]MCM1229376.1 sporulation initiation factor Spo0A C-terminal domain-containing protein [Ruminococcus flavefaciens]